MPHMPELPVVVPEDQVQVDGDKDTNPVFDTQRGFTPTSRDVSDKPPPNMKNREVPGWGRYVEAP